MGAPSKGRRGAMIGAALVALAVLIPLRGLFRAEGGSMEEGFMLVFPERVLAGDVPNKDFLHLYGPGSLWVLAGAFKAFGVSIFVERGVGLLHNLSLIGSVFVFALPWGPTVATVAALLALVIAITPIGLIALPWVGGLGFVTVGAVIAARALPDGPWADRRPERLTLLGGACFGFGLLYRPDLVLAVALAGAVLWWAADPSRRRRLVYGLLAGSSPMLIHLVMAGPANAFRGMFLQPVFDLREGRRLPVPPSGDDLDGYLQKINELDTLDWPAPFNTPQQIRLWFFVLLAATAFVAVVALLGVRRARPPWRSQLLLVGAAISVGILPQAVQRPDTTHLAWVACFTLPMLIVAIADLVERRSLESAPKKAWIASALVASLLVVVVFPFFSARRYADLSLQTFGRSRSATAVTHDGRTFYEGRADISPAFDELAAAVDEVTEPGDRLFVGPADLSRTPYVDSYLYHLFSDLVPATYYIEMDPGVADADDSGLEDDLATADVVVLSTLWDRWEEPNASVQDGSDASERVLAEQFCLRGTFGEPTIFELYTPC